MDTIYPRHLPSSNPPGQESDHSNSNANSEDSHQSGESPIAQETLLLTQDSGRKLARALDIPGLEVELERAIWQVETAMRKQSQVSEKSSPSESEQSKPEGK